MEPVNLLKAAVVFVPLFVAGCASWLAPSAEQLSALPVVQFGDPVPAGKDYILFFAPDRPIPVDAAVKGSIFAKEAQQRLYVTLRRGIYAHKEWISYDGKSWSKGRDAIETQVRVVIPGYLHPEPGTMSVRMDEKR
jgi:hypothetical protein